MINRKQFLKTGALGLLPLGWKGLDFRKKHSGNKPVIITTWKTGVNANKAAWNILGSGGYALDAVEAGVKVEEANEDNMTVGYGARPDRNGNVTLDACVMDKDGNCGSVAYLKDIMHPVSVARKVMESSPHVMIVGDGARQFAIAEGFETQNLLTPKAEEAWKKWLETSEYKPIMNIENHDTIGMLALDADGNLSGACTTSGAAWKMEGRVGDSPIIGAGLFVDPEVGAACATGLGEEVIKTAGSHLVVEMMRQGHSPEEACKIATERIISRTPANRENVQVGYVALNKDGARGGFSIQQGFSFVVSDTEGHQVFDSKHLI